MFNYTVNSDCPLYKIFTMTADIGVMPVATKVHLVSVEFMQ